MKCVVPVYAQIAAGSLVPSLEDKGQLGALTPALARQHLLTRKDEKGIIVLVVTHAPAAMSLRKAAWVAKLDLEVDMPERPFITAGRADLWEVVQDANRLHNVHADREALREYTYEPLWKLSVFDISQLVCAGGQQVMSWDAFRASNPMAGAHAPKASLIPTDANAVHWKL